MFTSHHLSHVRCQMWRVTCHIFVFFIFSSSKGMSYLVEDLLSMGPSLSSFFLMETFSVKNTFFFAIFYVISGQRFPWEVRVSVNADNRDLVTMDLPLRGTPYAPGTCPTWNTHSDNARRPWMKIGREVDRHTLDRRPSDRQTLYLIERISLRVTCVSILLKKGKW